jgi:hypothetical protein
MESDTLDGFVLYEMASRITPDTMLLLPEVMFAEVVAYVDQHVMPLIHAGTQGAQ